MLFRWQSCLPRHPLDIRHIYLERTAQCLFTFCSTPRYHMLACFFPIYGNSSLELTVFVKHSSKMVIRHSEFFRGKKYPPAYQILREVVGFVISETCFYFGSGGIRCHGVGKTYQHLCQRRGFIAVCISIDCQLKQIIRRQYVKMCPMPVPCQTRLA